MPHLSQRISLSRGPVTPPCERDKRTGEDHRRRRELAVGSARNPRAGARGARGIEGTADPIASTPWAATLVARRLCARAGAARSVRRMLLTCLCCLSVTLRPPQSESSRHTRRSIPVWFRLRRVRERSPDNHARFADRGFIPGARRRRRCSCITSRRGNCRADWTWT
jgi:hypothetical protein